MQKLLLTALIATALCGSVSVMASNLVSKTNSSPFVLAFQGKVQELAFNFSKENDKGEEIKFDVISVEAIKEFVNSFDFTVPAITPKRLLSFEIAYNRFVSAENKRQGFDCLQDSDDQKVPTIAKKAVVGFEHAAIIVALFAGSLAGSCYLINKIAPDFKNTIVNKGLNGFEHGVRAITFSN